VREERARGRGGEKRQKHKREEGEEKIDDKIGKKKRGAER